MCKQITRGESTCIDPLDFDTTRLHSKRGGPHDHPCQRLRLNPCHCDNHANASWTRNNLTMYAISLLLPNRTYCLTQQSITPPIHLSNCIYVFFHLMKNEIKQTFNDLWCWGDGNLPNKTWSFSWVKIIGSCVWLHLGQGREIPSSKEWTR